MDGVTDAKYIAGAVVNGVVAAAASQYARSGDVYVQVIVQ